MPIRTYIINGENLGSGPASHRHVHESYEAQRSEAYFCPICAEIWCRMPVSPAQIWSVTPVICERHDGDNYGVSGTLWKPWHHGPDWPECLPKKVLYRELELTIRHLEKFGHI